MRISFKAFILAWLATGSILTSNGQPTKNDSVNIHLENKLELRMVLYNKKNINSQVENDLKNLLVLLKDNQNIPNVGSWAINYKPNERLTIKEVGKTEKIIWEKGIQAHYGFNNQCNIHATDYFLSILFNDAKELESADMIGKIKEALESTYAKRGRITFTYNYNYEGDKLNFRLGKANGDMDMLMLKANVGAGLIKNQLVTDFTGEIGLAFCNEGHLRNQYYTSYNLMYYFEGGKTMLNPMINIGYRYNFARTTGKYNWLGAEIGFLTSRKGSLFDKNTWKVGFNWELGKYISASPQVFFTSDFSKAYPGIRIGFGF